MPVEPQMLENQVTYPATMLWCLAKTVRSSHAVCGSYIMLSFSKMAPIRTGRARGADTSTEYRSKLLRSEKRRAGADAAVLADLNIAQWIDRSGWRSSPIYARCRTGFSNMG